MHETTRRKQVGAILALGFVAGVAILLWVLWRAAFVSVTVTNRSERTIERVVLSLDAEGDERRLSTREVGSLVSEASKSCSLRSPSHDAYLSVECHFDDGTVEEAGEGYVTSGMFFVTFQVTIDGDGQIEVHQRP